MKFKVTAETQEIEAQKTHQEPIELTDDEIRLYVLDFKKTLMTGSIKEEVLCMYQIGSPNEI